MWSKLKQVNNKGQIRGVGGLSTEGQCGHQAATFKENRTAFPTDPETLADLKQVYMQRPMLMLKDTNIVMQPPAHGVQE